MDNTIQRKITLAARNEITEFYIYKNVAAHTKNKQNRQLLLDIASQEKKHYNYWQGILGHEVKPSNIKIWFYTTLTLVFGLSFSLKLMEKGESLAQNLYQDIGHTYPEALRIMNEEQRHEQDLLNLINEKFLNYVSSFVLGLNDALVELTGALAGFTLALQNTRLIAVVGLITGIAASLAMATSEYLSTREEAEKNAIQAGLVTGIAYFVTVILLILPYWIFSQAIFALCVTLSVAVLIILVFTFYTSVAKSLSFKKKFSEMAVISLGVAALNFVIGFLIKQYFGLEA
jgi:VIT1/CCC1 family predicted Fe2+/Mn2+ transporter